MKAVIVRAFDALPSYVEFAEPVAAEGELIVDVRAAALSQLVLAQAAGKHYSVDASRLPFIPGTDGVGRLADGKRVYFAFPRMPYGAMAERTTVRADHVVELAESVDDLTAAAIANPAMSSWAGLTLRAKFRAGESVLVNGATGASGMLAIRIARHLGAKRVVVTGRTKERAERLLSLGADRALGLDEPHLHDELCTELSSIDVVLDYLWGPSAERIFAALPHGHRLRFVQLGSLSAPSITLPANALRGSAVEVLGSGLGAISPRELVESVRCVFEAMREGGFDIDVESAPLEEVTRVWGRESARRIVLTTGV